MPFVWGKTASSVSCVSDNTTMLTSKPSKCCFCIWLHRCLKCIIYWLCVEINSCLGNWCQKINWNLWWL